MLEFALGKVQSCRELFLIRTLNTIVLLSGVQTGLAMTSKSCEYSLIMCINFSTSDMPFLIFKQGLRSLSVIDTAVLCRVLKRC